MPKPKLKRETKMENSITQEDKDRLIEMMAEALELCLECDGLTFSAEQAADVCLRRAKGK
jgi:hypothetical protein